jgi:NAD(P)-dependent dehydrogenase (short-subunit alcohol dehydrogenase family)
MSNPTPAQYDLQGRVAVVTGGAQGIGFATAQRLQRSGATVVLWDLDAERLPGAVQALAGGGPVSGEVVQLTDEAAVAAATAATIARHGRIDILVNNAGITGGNAPTWELSPAAWRQVVEVNLIAPFLTCRARGAGHDRQRLGPHRQHRLGGRQGGQPQRQADAAEQQVFHQAFCTCMRFSASSQTTDCGPSMTSASTSSPRCAGRQCMNSASGWAAHHLGVDAPVGKGLLAGFVLGLEAHAGPDVGGDQVGALAGGERALEGLQAARVAPRRPAGVDLVAAGRADVQREAQDVGRLQPGVGHVVAVAHPGHHLALRSSRGAR